MEQTLRQVGELLLGSIPTIIFLLMVYGIYTFLLYRPMSRVLAERRRRTEGAVEKAHADIAQAESKSAEYELRLREARVQVFKGQEARRQQAERVREQAISEARAKAQAKIDRARATIEDDKVAARATLQSEAGALSQEIIRVVLQPAKEPAPAAS
ncbi:MAG: ATP synthase F0 subunit B [Acidobacteriales bacterium]|nr:ATP synthase F0 subunit B [Terriglobales bacterium]